MFTAPKGTHFCILFQTIAIIIVNYYSLMSYFPYVTCVSRQDRIPLFRQCFLCFLVHYYSAIPFHIGEGALECRLPVKFSENKIFLKMSRLMRLWHLLPSVNSIFKHTCAANHWRYSSDFWSDPWSTCTSILRVCEQRNLWRDFSCSSGMHL